MLCEKRVSLVTFLVLISSFIPLLPAWSGPRPRAYCGAWEPLLGGSRGFRERRLHQQGKGNGLLDVDDSDNSALHPRVAAVGARVTFVGCLGLRGGGFLDEEGSLGHKDPNERRQTRRLGLAKEKWKRKYRGDNHFDSSDLSDEDQDDEDRPDVYKKPKLPPPPVRLMHHVMKRAQNLFIDYALFACRKSRGIEYSSQNLQDDWNLLPKP